MRPLLLAALAACAPSSAGTTGTTSTSTTSSATGAPTSSGGTTDACVGSGECDTDSICVADYTPSPDAVHPGARGPAACIDQNACVAALDLERWCFDHQGCCESLRCRTADGVCEPSDLGQTGSESSTTTTAATDTGSTTTTTTGATGSATGSSG